MPKRKAKPIHPGEILLEDFMKPMELSQYALAKAISVPPRRINEIVHGKRSITADTALRLGEYFRVDPQSWMNLQSHYDLELAEMNLGKRLKEEVTPRAA
ncbi:MAG: HigA family addiction module antidote protein [Candidatus Omnitrophica bacterium]|nr:HigA family addiction module antidote protein [Candidatus Omnitrophota bacterium]MCA9427979.1 HigA family addiction module antidote protein [Candidatus Omnitrophota bacterium]MCA9430904.1 HigA family addiction module antidote protein [Candidatus Omnitrophota bacterium]MCA9445216.1 HigA family addiction module antidote protein [Candidatus Omnitrophota bacterium]MCA9447771.1 HigA family addiction module antidote protein [Candidatus Omnitrophota bacterium]